MANHAQNLGCRLRFLGIPCEVHKRKRSACFKKVGHLRGTTPKPLSFWESKQSYCTTLTRISYWRALKQSKQACWYRKHSAIQPGKCMRMRDMPGFTEHQHALRFRDVFDGSFLDKNSQVPVPCCALIFRRGCSNRDMF